MPKKSRGESRSAGLTVDFTGVETGGGGRLLPEGEYQLTVKEVTDEVGESSGAPYLKWVFAVANGEYKGAKVYDNTSLQPQALWKVRGLLEAGGQTVNGKFTFEPLRRFIGMTLGATLEHEEYDGKKKAKVASYFSSTNRDKADEEDQETDEESDSLEEGTKVTFMDGKKKLKGTITAVNDDGSYDVATGDDEWKLTPDEFEVA